MKTEIASVLILCGLVAAAASTKHKPILEDDSVGFKAPSFGSKYMYDLTNTTIATRNVSTVANSDIYISEDLTNGTKCYILMPKGGYSETASISCVVGAK